jgi:hypothetical protein
MNVFTFLASLTLYLVSIPSQALQSSSSISKSTKMINPIEGVNINPNSSDRFYVSNISQNTSQITNDPRISVTAAPNITEILSIIDTDMFLVAISPDEQIAIFAADYSCYSIYNISNLEQPTVLSQLCFALGVMPTNLGVISSDSKTGFFVNQDQDALLMVDLSNPTYPSIINSFSFITPPSQYYPVKTSSMVLSSDGQTLFIQSQVLSPIITIIDISNPVSLINISAYAVPSASNSAYISELCISNNMLFSMSNSVYVIDISDLENPTTLSTIDAGSIPLNLAVSSNGQYLFVVSADGEYQAYLEVFDLSNISSIAQQS